MDVVVAVDVVLTLDVVLSVDVVLTVDVVLSVDVVLTVDVVEEWLLPSRYSLNFVKLKVSFTGSCLASHF